MSQYEFDFEPTDVYAQIREVARWTRTVEWPEGDGDLKNQARRAAGSMALNAAEGWMRRGRAGKNQFRIALGSAGEVLAVLDLVDLPRGPEMQQRLRRIGAMLRKLT